MVTEWNKMGKMQDISLSEDGRKLAQKTADGLKKHKKFDYIFSSPLERAMRQHSLSKGTEI